MIFPTSLISVSFCELIRDYCRDMHCRQFIYRVPTVVDVLSYSSIRCRRDRLSLGNSAVALFIYGLFSKAIVNTPANFK